MTPIVFDVNVVLDVLLDRKPHAASSAAVWATVEAGTAEGLLAAYALTTIHYLARKDTGSVIQEALQLRYTDFEDAMAATAARRAGRAHIVMTYPKRFRGSPVRALTPEVAVQILRGE
jgi:hypothetical protein